MKRKKNKLNKIALNIKNNPILQEKLRGLSPFLKKQLNDKEKNSDQMSSNADTINNEILKSCNSEESNTPNTIFDDEIEKNENIVAIRKKSKKIFENGINKSINKKTVFYVDGTNEEWTYKQPIN